MKHPLITFLFIAFVLNDSYAQTTIIKELKKQIINASTEQERLSATLLLCDQGYSLHPDTLMQYSIEAAHLADNLRDLHKHTIARYYQSFALTNYGLTDSSLAIANECLKLIPSRLNDPELYANLLNQKGRCFMRKNHYKEAIDMGLKVVSIAEKSGDTLLQIKGKTLIGWAYLEMGPASEALKWHLRAFKTTKNKKLLDNYGILYANLALNYNSIGKTDSAFYFIEKATEASRRNENLFALSNSLAIQAQLYVLSGNGKLAEVPLKEVVEIRKLIGDPFYIVSDMAQLALYYAHNGMPQKGILLCKEGLEIAMKYHIDTKLFFLYSTLAENYKAAGNTTAYASTLEKIISLKDSVYRLNTAEALAEMQGKYNLQKKENQIIRQRLDLSQQRYLFWGLLIFFLFLVIIAALLFIGYKRKHRLKMQTMHREEARLKKEAISKAQEDERKRIAADLHDNLGAYASAILASVEDLDFNSGQKRQMVQNMKVNAAGIMMDLRDTIWVLQKEDISMTDISDRFKNFVQKISPSYPKIEIDIKEDIENNKLLSPQVALNLLRIMQEAFHNAVKHSQCSQINIYIGYKQGPEIKISDNGVGLGDNMPEKSNGNGLYNMQMRAEAQGFRVSFNKVLPSGTEVELRA